ncbi:MAG: four helix bundle protein [Crocinitomicaceae bacterium]|nr:four helix bundle protein [Crocinitomicaceae bacterium]
MSHNFRELAIWKRSLEFAIDTYKTTRKLPPYEKYGLASQIQRAAASISSNIAEGSARTTNKEFSRFLDFSLGSSNEAETQLQIARRVYPKLEIEISILYSELRQIQKMIAAFQNGLDKE